MESIDVNRPIWQLTVAEFLELDSVRMKRMIEREERLKKEHIDRVDGKKYVRGIKGIADLFGCSIAWAQQLKNNGIISDAITQRGRVILTDVDLAWKLYNDHRSQHSIKYQNV